MESQFPEEVPLSIPAPLKAHMEDECFWILCRQKLLRLPRKPNVEDLLRQFYYHSIATPTDEMSPALLAEVMDGIKIYFDFMTEDHLLYAPEREQFRLTMADQQRNKRKSSRHKSSNTHPTQDSPNLENSLPTSHLERAPTGTPQQPHQSKSHLEHTPSSSNSCQPEAVLMPSQVYGAEHLLRLCLKFPLFLSQAQLPVAHVQFLNHCFKDLLGYLSTRRAELFLEENYYDLGPGEEDTAQPEGGEGGEGGEEREQQAPSANTTT